MTTKFSSISAAIVAALSAATAVSTHIERARQHPIPDEWDDAVVVRPAEADVQTMTVGRYTGGRRQTEFRIVVECYARSASVSADVAVDALLQAVEARIAADDTLGGIAAGCELARVEWDFAAGAERLACATLHYVVTFDLDSYTLA